MSKDNIRNIAIIAHVDHGKTTLVDGLLKQSGTFSDHAVVEERVMDSGDLEKERGITITSKNTAIQYEDIKINIVDTPGHADFGGEVERSLNLVDGVLLLVDSSEGPLPQTRFVLKKALEKKLPVVLVINKIDKPDARVDEVVQETYDLFIDLDANDDQIEFPIIYTNAKDGLAVRDLKDNPQDLTPLFKLITTYFEGPDTSDEAATQFLVTNLSYDSYVGQVAIGRLDSGDLNINEKYSLCTEENIINNIKLSALYTFNGLDRVSVDTLESGDIIAVAGIENVIISKTGYTGSGGIEIYCANKHITSIWKEVFNAGKKYNIKPIGLAARNTLRLEMGFCLYGNDIDENTSPIEAGLSWITRTETNFYGSSFIEEDIKKGCKYMISGIKSEERIIPRKGNIILNSDKEKIGRITSGTFSPTLKTPIGIGFILKDKLNYGEEVFVDINRKIFKAKIYSLPFIKS